MRQQIRPISTAFTSFWLRCLTLILMGGTMLVSQPLVAQKEVSRQLSDRVMKRNAYGADLPIWASHVWLSYLADSTSPTALNNLALVYRMMDDEASALKCYQKSYVASHYDKEIGQLLLSSAIRLGDMATAEEVGTRLLKDCPNDVRYLAQVASIYDVTRQYAKELELLQKIIDQDRMNVSLLYQKSQLLERLGRPQEAVKVLNDRLAKKIDNKENTINLYYSLLSLYRSRNDIKGLNETLNRFKAVAPEDPILIHTYAMEYLSKHAYQKVASEVKRASVSEGIQPEQLQGLISDLLQNATNTNALLKHLLPVQELIVKEYPNSADLSKQLLMEYDMLSDSLNARRVAKMMIANDQGSPFPYIYLSNSYASSGQFAKADSVSRAGLQQFPKQAVFYLQAVVFSMNKNHSKETLDLLTQGLENANPADPAYAQLLLLKADAVTDSDFPLAASLYEKAIGLNPNFVLAYNNYAYALATHKEYQDLKKAEELASKAVKLDSNNASVLDTYAWILYLRGNYTLSKIYMDSALRHLDKDDNKAIFYKHYALLMEAFHDKEEAAKYWEMYLANGGKKSVAQKHLKHLKSK